MDGSDGLSRLRNRRVTNADIPPPMNMTAIGIAADKGHAWTTSDQLMEEADSAAREGDESLAISLADEARIHAELAAAQADREAAAWHDNVIAD